MKKILFSLLMLCCVAVAMAGPVPGGYTAKDYSELKAAINNSLSADGKTSNAKIKLTADIYLKDEGELCNTFTGTLDGNGYTIYAGDENAHHDGRGLAHGKYLFTYSEGATFKNLTFKDFRADTDEHSNWSFLTSQASKGCVFENITFDHVSIWSNYSNVGAVAGIATDCTFTNITVKNGDFTVDDNNVGAVVGNASGCTFTNIEVNACEATADDDYAGGVVGYASNNCTFTGIQVKNSFIKLNGKWAGGVTGFAQDSHFTGCIIDDMSCVCADGNGYDNDAYVGGVAGQVKGCDFLNCVNSALIAADEKYAGGIVGWAYIGTTVESCLNTGMIFSAAKEDVVSDYYSKYKNKEMACVTKRYQGKEYAVRKMVYERSIQDEYFGGIIGSAAKSTILKCTNLGYTNNLINSGGIVGSLYMGSTIKDCLCDFEAASNKVMGVAGDMGWANDGSDEAYIIANTLNLTSSRDYTRRDTGKATNDFSGMYSYFDKNFTEDELATGEICTKLGDAWEQNIGVDPYPTPTGNKGVYHSRNVKNTYGTVCLPFAVKSDDNVRFYLMDKVNNGENEVTIGFKYVETVEAGHPALFSVENSGDITFTPSDNEWADQPYTHGSGSDWHFVGTFKATVFDGEDAKTIYYVSGDKIRNANKTNIAPFRAYFNGPSIEALTATGAKSISFVVEDEDGETTAIEFADFDSNSNSDFNFNFNSNFNFNGKTYSIMGTQVNEDYRGIVIKNGKKYLNN